MAKEFRNTKVKDISVSKTTGQYNLTVVQESPFAGFADAGVEHVLTLFSRRNKEVDEATVERTEAELRKQLGDDNIIFTDPQDATDDDNHIENWIAANVGAKVALITQNDGFFNLGEGLSGGGSFGDSKYLKGYKAVDGSYDPTQHRVPFFDALSASQQDAIRTLDANKYPEIQTSARSSYIGINVDGVVSDVILSRANTYGSTPSKVTREELREEIIDSLAGGKRVNEDNQALADQIEALPEGFPYIDLLRILGGSTAEYVKGAKQGSISGMLDNADRTSVRFYVQIPETGYIFQTTDFKAGGNARTLESQNNVQFEFLTDDFTEADLVRFLSNIAGLQGTKLDIQHIFEVVVEEGLYDQDEGKFNIDGMEDLLKVLRTLFVGRKVEIQSTLQSSRGKQDLDKLGTNVRSLSMEKNVDVLQKEVITEGVASTVTETVEETTADEGSSTPDNPFAPAPEVAEEVEEEDTAPENPFAAASEEAEDDVEEEVEEEDEDEEEDLMNNPFT